MVEDHARLRSSHISGVDSKMVGPVHPCCLIRSPNQATQQHMLFCLWLPSIQLGQVLTYYDRYDP